MIRFLAKGLGFGAVFAVSYVVCMTAVAALEGHKLVPNVFSVRGGSGFTLTRFSEIDEYRDLDILFAGSSHAYRGFDVRLFREAGYDCFNLGSSQQSPMNTYYLLRRYLPQLRPKVLVMEVYWGALKSNGVESTIDLVSNLPASCETAWMAAETADIACLNSWVYAALRNWMRPLRLEHERKSKYDDYAPGGFVATQRKNKARPELDRAVELNLKSEHFADLARIVDLCREHGTRVVFVLAPVAPEYTRVIYDYDRAMQRLAEFAAQHDCEFWDFNGEPQLYDAMVDFYDLHHLNQHGVEKFNARLLDRMAARSIDRAIRVGQRPRDRR